MELVGFFVRVVGVRKCILGPRITFFTMWLARSLCDCARSQLSVYGELCGVYADLRAVGR